MKKLILFILFGVASIPLAKGQVLISLLLGDKLNSDKLAFGLDGGASLTNISNLEGAERRTGLYLGFYFDFKLKNQWSLYTGVMVKSPTGAEGLPSYTIGNAQLDPLLTMSTVERKLNYFNVPVLMRYHFQNHLFLEGGIQLGLLYKAKDIFKGDVQTNNDFRFENDIIDQYKRLDYGLSAGMGYRLMKGEGITLGMRYYAGLADIDKTGTNSQKNNAFYIFANIPIGGVKKSKEGKE